MPEKWYHVHLVEEICGDAFVKAESAKEAEEKALYSPDVDVDWNNDSETHVCLVEEANEDDVVFIK